MFIDTVDRIICNFTEDEDTFNMSVSLKHVYVM